MRNVVKMYPTLFSAEQLIPSLYAVLFYWPGVQWTRPQVSLLLLLLLAASPPHTTSQDCDSCRVSTVKECRILLRTVARPVRVQRCLARPAQPDCPPGGRIRCKVR